MAEANTCGAIFLTWLHARILMCKCIRNNLGRGHLSQVKLKVEQRRPEKEPCDWHGSLLRLGWEQHHGLTGDYSYVQLFQLGLASVFFGFSLAAEHPEGGLSCVLASSSTCTLLDPSGPGLGCRGSSAALQRFGTYRKPKTLKQGERASKQPTQTAYVTQETHRSWLPTTRTRRQRGAGLKSEFGIGVGDGMMLRNA